jgi:hypothetical protein
MVGVAESGQVRTPRNGLTFWARRPGRSSSKWPRRADLISRFITQAAAKLSLVLWNGDSFAVL